MTYSNSWKDVERKLAKELGTLRLPNTGYGNPDFETERFSYQSKKRKSMPKWIWDAIDQATADASEGKVPVVAFTESKQGIKRKTLMVVTLEDWKKITGEGSNE